MSVYFYFVHLKCKSTIVFQIVIWKLLKNIWRLYINIFHNVFWVWTEFPIDQHINQMDECGCGKWLWQVALLLWSEPVQPLGFTRWCSDYYVMWQENLQAIEIIDKNFIQLRSHRWSSIVNKRQGVDLFNSWSFYLKNKNDNLNNEKKARPLSIKCD